MKRKYHPKTLFVIKNAMQKRLCMAIGFFIILDIFKTATKSEARRLSALSGLLFFCFFGDFKAREIFALFFFQSVGDEANRLFKAWYHDI